MTDYVFGDSFTFYTTKTPKSQIDKSLLVFCSYKKCETNRDVSNIRIDDDGLCFCQNCGSYLNVKLKTE